MAIDFFQRVLVLSYGSALDLFCFAAGVLLVSVAPYFSIGRLSGEEAEGRVREEQ